jgi:hypothetical protein
MEIANTCIFTVPTVTEEGAKEGGRGDQAIRFSRIRRERKKI